MRVSIRYTEDDSFTAPQNILVNGIDIGGSSMNEEKKTKTKERNDIVHNNENTSLTATGLTVLTDYLRHFGFIICRY